MVISLLEVDYHLLEMCQATTIYTNKVLTVNENAEFTQDMTNWNTITNGDVSFNENVVAAKDMEVKGTLIVGAFVPTADFSIKEKFS